MAFVSEIFDQLRDLLNDAADTIPFTTKRLYVNRGIARLWPGVSKVASVTIVLVAGTYDYALTAPVMDGHILSVEISMDTTAIEFIRFNRYDVIPGDEDLAGVFRLLDRPSRALTVRIKYVAPIAGVAAGTYAAAQSEVWAGPDRALNLPVMYAMGMLTARKLDDRQDALRYSTTQAANGVSDQDLMATSQLWFAQFELELDAQSRPLPPARD